MARFAVIAAAVITVMIFDAVSISTANPGNGLGPKPKLVWDQLDDWQCQSTFVPLGVSNCITINTCPVKGALTGPTPTGCGWRMPEFCDATVDADVDAYQAALPPADAAPADYTVYPGVGSYKLHTEHKTWLEAKAICEAEGEGISLAIPSTTAEYAAAKSMMNTVLPTDNVGFWVGMSDIAVEGQFETIFGQPLCDLPLVLWVPYQPSNSGGNEDCLGIGLYHYGQLNDYNCAQPLPFLCEKPLSSRLTSCGPCQ